MYKHNRSYFEGHTSMVKLLLRTYATMSAHLEEAYIMHYSGKILHTYEFPPVSAD